LEDKRLEKVNDISKSKTLYAVVIFFLMAVLVITVITAVSLGQVNIKVSDTYKIIFGKLIHNDEIYNSFSKAMIAIVWNMRLPRVLLGLLAGAGLALCGCVMQATVNNPISEPYILGVSSGATFGATLLIVMGLGAFVSGGAFVGAVIATVMVLGIASGHGKMTTTRLILAGTVVNALFTAFSNFIISVGANADSIMTIKFWTMGSLAGWKSIILPAVVVIAVTLFFCTQYRILNTMMLGDETAVTLGINLSLYRKVYMTLIAVVTGVLVSSCGIIGFVGLIIPHISRAFAGTNHKRLVPVVILLGAIFLIWADVLARILVKNAELPIGIFTALVGAPFFIYIVTKKNYGRE
jgi:iron complex transport system permease protein